MFREGKSQLSIRTLAMTALVLAPAAAYAATAGDISISQVLNTSPLWADAASYHACNAVNVTTATVKVAVELIGATGNVITGSSTLVAIPAGTSTEISDFNTSTGTTNVGFARCRFTLDDAPGTIRGNMTIFHPLSGGNFQIYATSEAR